MSLTQDEADHLLSLEKTFVSTPLIEFHIRSPFEHMYDLVSADRREQFLLDVERGGRTRARLKFQTRARRTIVLARIDINGKAHRNLDHYPHRPGERFTGVHIHLYREGFGDRVAFLPEDLPAFRVPAKPHDLDWLTAFLDYCNIINRPIIQTVM
jgi:hypothetical protein